MIRSSYCISCYKWNKVLARKISRGMNQTEQSTSPNQESSTISISANLTLTSTRMETEPGKLFAHTADLLAVFSAIVSM